MYVIYSIDGLIVGQVWRFLWLNIVSQENSEPIVNIIHIYPNNNELVERPQQMSVPELEKKVSLTVLLINYK